MKKWIMQLLAFLTLCTASKIVNSQSYWKEPLNQSNLKHFTQNNIFASPGRMVQNRLSRSTSAFLGCKKISEFVNNNPKITWKAATKSLIYPQTYLMERNMVDSLINLSRQTNTEPQENKLPGFYDARERYPDCPSLHRVEDIGYNCAASWAVAPVSSLSDRFCILSEGKITPELSATKLLTCCSYCFWKSGCEGGSSTSAWFYLRANGTVTGGPYGSFRGCQSYPINPHTGFHPQNVYPQLKCQNGCDTLRSVTIYRTSRSYDHKKTTNHAIQLDIFNNGPVSADMNVHEDFYCYKSGIYSKVIGKRTTIQTVKLIGWGEENGVKYWLAANTWGAEWGDEGFFKIKRGSNECNIEVNVKAGIPELLNQTDYNDSFI